MATLDQKMDIILWPMAFLDPFWKAEWVRVLTLKANSEGSFTRRGGGLELERQGGRGIRGVSRAES